MVVGFASAGISLLALHFGSPAPMLNLTMKDASDFLGQRA